MFAVVENLRIHYKLMGDNKGEVVVLLHGWGQSINCFCDLVHDLPNYHYLLIDLPGFGLSQVPYKFLTVDDYARLVKKLLNGLGISSAVVLGHSFGGKIGCLLASIYPVKKLVLIGSAGINLPKKFNVRMKIWLARLLKKISNFFPNILSNFGSKDYQQVHGVMRQILVHTVNHSIATLLPNLKMPVLLIWGDRDTVTPTGQYFKRLLPQAKLVILPGDHFVFLQAKSQFYQQLSLFWA